ncbi:energy transducer TonB [Massilia sp. TS11]|uniref:energy transducer TonB n=1 Tax=Massilia sp. TS11 TaxID=2908003 RepID=UPI001EDB3A82|nr:energy transducer TonB [Massilia sp. TS11]MCG2585597.1 energy transducer TonB [Massilia sp. TS11]
MFKTVTLAVALFAANAAFASEVPASLDTSACKVDYPKSSLINEEQGTVQVKFLVSADGKVQESKVEKTSGFKTLDNAAIKGLSACKFKPGSKDGSPASTWTKVEYTWKL